LLSNFRSPVSGLRSPVSKFSTSYFVISPSQRERRRAFTLPKLRERFAFTLVELLVVMAIIAILMVLIAPAFTNIKTGNDITTAAYTIKGVLDQARTYAMANNTYVFVGFEEVDASKLDSVSPQTATTTTVGGRIAVAAVASRDGTRGYTVSTSLPSPAWSNYNNGANLIAVGKLQRLENLHLAPLSSTLPNSGGLTRQTVSSDSYQLGNNTANPNPTNCVTPFDWPLGSVLGSGQYSFVRVINFDPQGVARIQYATNADEIVTYIDIGLQQTHANLATPTPSSTPGNVAAIQIDCMTGTTRLYRP
jgi:prepilin-type N-terminal cleavage/methylation domain-containing protein